MLKRRIWLIAVLIAGCTSEKSEAPITPIQQARHTVIEQAAPSAPLKEPEATGEPAPEVSGLSNKASYEALLAYEKKWEMLDSLAKQTPRIALAERIAALQDLRMELDHLQVAKCYETALADLRGIWDAQLKAYTHFLGKEEIESIIYQIKEPGMLDTYHLHRNGCPTT